MHYWSTYEGRRVAVVEQTNFKQKVPIPVSIDKALCFFPTHSPTHIDNGWIAPNHVARIHEKAKRHIQNQIKIIFKNGYTKTLDISEHTFETQMQRAFVVMYKSGMIEL